MRTRWVAHVTVPDYTLQATAEPSGGGSRRVVRRPAHDATAASRQDAVGAFVHHEFVATSDR